MNTLRDDLNEVINSENISGLKFLRMNNWQWILDRLAEEFLSDGKRSLDRIWLWDSIKEPYQSYQPDNSIEELASLLTDSETYWFIVSDEDGKYWVLEGTGEAIVRVVSDTYYFEYYITDKNISWMICENHHGAMVLKGLNESHKSNA